MGREGAGGAGGGSLQGGGTIHREHPQVLGGDTSPGVLVCSRGSNTTP